MSDVDLLDREVDLIWGPGSDEPWPLLVAIVANDGHRIRSGPELAAGPAERVSAVWAAHPAPPVPDTERIDRPWPPVIGEIDHIMRDTGASSARESLSFVFEDAPTGTEHPWLVRSDAASVDPVRHVQPTDWEAEEWNLLLDGALGPWAMVFDGAEVLAICHTARSGAGAAEAGVWTRADHRRRGYAVAVTESWAALAAREYDTLYDSTSGDNLGSQQVAARLQRWDRKPLR